MSDVNRGVSRTLTTDQAGQYVAPDLLPGTYSVRAEASGFKAAEHSGLLLEVGKDVRVDLTLQPGEQSQTVTVSGEPSVRGKTITRNRQVLLTAEVPAGSTLAENLPVIAG